MCEQRDIGLLYSPFLDALMIRIEAACFSRTLGTLIDNGVTLPQGLAMTSGMQSVEPASARGTGRPF